MRSHIKQSTDSRQLRLTSRKARGYTLVEAVVVIAILGIVAAVVLPRFLAVRDDALRASIKSVTGAMKSTSSLIRAKVLLEGIENGNITLEGNNVQIKGGYISGNWNKAWKYALDLGSEIPSTNKNRTCTANAFCAVGNQKKLNGAGLPITLSARGLVLVWPKGMKLSDRCYAYYYNPRTGEEPKIGNVLTGC